MTSNAAQERADQIKAQRDDAGTLGKVAAPARADVTRGRATHVVFVEGAWTDAEALAAAMAVARETRASLFGWDVRPLNDDDPNGIRRVTLHAD